MKLEPEDPRLTAHALGELDASEVAAVENAIEADPQLQAEVRQIKGIQDYLSTRLSSPGGELLPAQRELIRRTALGFPASSAGHPFASFRNAVYPWLIPAAAAAVLAIATFILFRMPRDTAPTETAGSPAAESSKESDGVQPPEGIPAEPSNRAVISMTSPRMLDLPVNPERSGLESITRSILTDGRFPPKESVRTCEILNNFQFRLGGMASISRTAAEKWHPDNRGDSGMSNHIATLSSELISCPWKPSSRLLIVSLRANPRTDSDVKLTYHANPGTVRHHRLLGFKNLDGPAIGNPPSRLPSGSIVNLALEIEPSEPGGDLGSLEWSTDGENAPPIPVVLNPGAEPSDDARFAALVCTYSEWLAGEQAGMIDADIVAALAREIRSSTLSPDRVEFLNLIDASILLGGK